MDTELDNIQLNIFQCIILNHVIHWFPKYSKNLENLVFQLHFKTLLRNNNMLLMSKNETPTNNPNIPPISATS